MGDTSYSNYNMSSYTIRDDRLSMNGWVINKKLDQSGFRITRFVFIALNYLNHSFLYYKLSREVTLSTTSRVVKDEIDGGVAN